MNHKQKAGEIHSLAWIPQSIHMAFLAVRSFLETCPKKTNNNNKKLQYSTSIYIVLIFNSCNKSVKHTLFSAFL